MLRTIQSVVNEGMSCDIDTPLVFTIEICALRGAPRLVERGKYFMRWELRAIDIVKFLKTIEVRIHDEQLAL